MLTGTCVCGNLGSVQATSTVGWALAPLFLLALAFVVWVVLDITRAERVRHLPKWAWVILTVFSIPVGGIVYLLVGRDRAG